MSGNVFSSFFFQTSTRYWHYCRFSENVWHIKKERGDGKDRREEGRSKERNWGRKEGKTEGKKGSVEVVRKGIRNVRAGVLGLVLHIQSSITLGHITVPLWFSVFSAQCLACSDSANWSFTCWALITGLYLALCFKHHISAAFMKSNYINVYLWTWKSWPINSCVVQNICPQRRNNFLKGIQKTLPSQTKST